MIVVVIVIIPVFVVTASAPIDDETLYIYYVLCTIQVLPEYNQVQYRYKKKKKCIQKAVKLAEKYEQSLEISPPFISYSESSQCFLLCFELPVT